MTSRLKALILTALVIGVIALGFGHRIGNEITLTLLLRQPSPDVATTKELIGASKNPARLLQRFWDTKKIPHRYAALSYLAEHTAAGAPIPEGAVSIVDAAALDVDNNVRELALSILARFSRDEYHSHLRRQLYDADQANRIHALGHLRKNESQSMMADVVRLLDDREPLVIAAAAGVLRSWTGKDFGVRNVDAVAKPQESGPNQVPRENLERLQAGVKGWEQWWGEHHADFPSTPKLNESTRPPQLATEDFELFDLEGKSVRLSDFRGKTVLLNFWTTWCTACASEIPDLVYLDEHYGDNLVILGISLDGSDGHGHEHAAFVDLEEANQKGLEAVEGLRDTIDHDHHHDHDGHEHQAAKVDMGKIKKKIERTIKRKGITYPILLNPSGSIGNRFNGHELPTNVLIDIDGFIRRRFIGSRPLPTWQALIDEIR